MRAFIKTASPIIAVATAGEFITSARDFEQNTGEITEQHKLTNDKDHGK